ncbi:hypothetical protein ACRAWF_06075 [Streptomyces sp. L7]
MNTPTGSSSTTKTIRISSSRIGSSWSGVLLGRAEVVDALDGCCRSGAAGGPCRPRSRRVRRVR